ncbi:hypothetical protein B0H11DRAFT_1899642 [Mycena galericulata]|nr:hypothetical protein B0H11DRAFT_1899642 [Mycena galericulata]
MRCNSTTSNIDCTQFGTPRPPLSTSVPRTLMVTNPSTSRQVGSGMGAWTCSRHRGLHVLSEHLSLHREFFDLSHNTYFDHPLPAPKHFLATFDVNAMRAGSTGRGRMSGLAGEGRGEQLAAEGQISAQICAFRPHFGWADLSRSGHIPADGIITGSAETWNNEGKGDGTRFR